jgi:predicted RecB family nuclease
LGGSPPDLEQRARLLTYNSDDVRATHALRLWMSSAAVNDVPYAGDL